MMGCESTKHGIPKCWHHRHWRAWAADPRDRGLVGSCGSLLCPAARERIGPNWPRKIPAFQVQFLLRACCFCIIVKSEKSLTRMITDRATISRGPSVFSMNTSQVRSSSMEKDSPSHVLSLGSGRVQCVTVTRLWQRGVFVVSPSLYFPRRPALPPRRKVDGGRLLSVSEYSLNASSEPGPGLRAFYRHVIPSGLVLGPDLGTGWLPILILASLCYFKRLILKRKKEKYVSVHLLNCALLTPNTCRLLNVDTAHHRAREKCSLVRNVARRRSRRTHRTHLDVMFLDAASQKRGVVLLHGGTGAFLLVCSSLPPRLSPSRLDTLAFPVPSRGRGR